MPEISVRQAVEKGLEDFAAAWKSGDIDGACASCYGEGAVFLTAKNPICGRTAIAEHYKKGLPEDGTTGDLILRLFSLEQTTNPDGTPVVIAVVEWNLLKQNGEGRSGFTLAVYKYQGDALQVAYDASV